jgi:hypothetical protein
MEGEGVVPCILSLGINGQIHTLTALLYEGGWVGPRAGLDAVKNNCCSCGIRTSIPRPSDT